MRRWKRHDVTGSRAFAAQPRGGPCVDVTRAATTTEDTDQGLAPTLGVQICSGEIIAVMFQQASARIK